MSQERAFVLFVDDDSLILQGYRRALRAFNTSCNFLFANSGAEALEILSGQSCDIIVSDMKMPEMDGSRLLGKVRQQYPAVVRVALSGQSDNEMLMRSMLTAHQYLAKPCESTELISCIMRILDIKRGCEHKEILNTISGIGLLPCLPEAWECLAAESLCEELDLGKIAKIVDDDISLAAKVLQVANSAAIGASNKTYSPTKAVGILGADRFRLLSAAAEALEISAELRDEGACAMHMYAHARQTAHLARYIAADLGADETLQEISQSAGLLHDIGKLVFVEGAPSSYAHVLREIKGSGKSEGQAEKEILGIQHALAGATLCGLWGLPQEIVSVIQFHHHPQAVAESLKVAAIAVHVADYYQHKYSVEAQSKPSFDLDFSFLEAAGYADRLAVWEDSIKRYVQGEAF